MPVFVRAQLKTNSGKDLMGMQRGPKQKNTLSLVCGWI